MLREVSVLQVALLLCLQSGAEVELMFQTAEVGKIKNLEDRLKIHEMMLQNQNLLMTTLSDSVKELKRQNEGLRTPIFQDELDALQKENKALRMEVEALKNQSEAKMVAFSASLYEGSDSVYIGPFSPVTSPLVYKSTTTNYGNAYDTNTGIFTAPLRGLYYFRFNANAHSGNTLGVNLLKNNQVQCSVYAGKATNSENASNGVVLTLEKGDQVYTKLWENAWVYDSSNSYTTFGEFLLFPL